MTHHPAPRVIQPHAVSALLNLRATTDEDDAWLLAEIGNALATAAAADQGLICPGTFAPVEQVAGRLWDEAWGKPDHVGQKSEWRAAFAGSAAATVIWLGLHAMGWF